MNNVLKEHYYDEGVSVMIPGNLLLELTNILEDLVNTETRTESRYKYNYVNSKGNVVKKVSQEDVDSGKVKKVLDWHRTIINPTLEHSITDKGIKYANIMLHLQDVHYKNIESGNTVSIHDAIKKEQKSKLK